MHGIFGIRNNPKNPTHPINPGSDNHLSNALLVPILAQTFFSLMGRHFMALPLLSAWH